MIGYLNQNAGAVTGLATLALLLVTAFYAWTTYQLLSETKKTRLLGGQPRIVAYFRIHEVHTNIPQLCIANLSGAAAVGVSASIEKVTDWPTDFELQDSKILRDLTFMRPHEVLKFDLGIGPSLFKDGVPAKFDVKIRYASLDGREFSFEDILRVESVEGRSHFKIYSVDDVARRLKDIADTLSGFTGFRRLRVETYDAQDRENEHKAAEERRARIRSQNSSDDPETSGETP